MKILVTGGAGFIGYHLCDELSKNLNNEILILDNLSRGSIDNDFQRLLERPNVRYLRGDLTDGSIYSTIGTGYNLVFHLAAVLGVKRVIERPVDVLRINIVSLFNLLEWFVQGGGIKLYFLHRVKSMLGLQNISPFQYRPPRMCLFH